MGNTTQTPYMGLNLPIPSVETGPQWATDLNTAITGIDSHNHTSGQGLQIPTAGLNINADLAMGNYNLTGLKSARFQSQGSTLSGASDLGCLYISGGNLYYNNGTGQAIQITAGAALNATSIGGIGGDYATSTASEFYTTSSSTFSLWSASNTAANLVCGNISLYQGLTSGNAVKLKCPTSLASAYNMTMPQALPSLTQNLTMDTSGNMGFSALIPTGIIFPYAGSSAPTGGWLLCDGSAVSRTTYATLFSLLGITHGQGDGSTTFNVPDYRGRFLRGADNMGSGAAGNDPDAASRSAMHTGGNTGNNVGSVQSHAFQDHTHTTRIWFDTGIVAADVARGTTATNPGSVEGTSTASGNTSTETRPINAYVLYIIKT